MRKVLKIFAWIIGVLLFLIVTLTVVAKLSENKIADIASEKVSEIIQAPLKVGEVSFNLLRKFPYATIEINGILLTTPPESQRNDSMVYVGDSILNLGKIYLSVKTRPLIDGVIEVIKVEIEDVNVAYLVNSKGQTNIDFLVPPTDTTLVEEVDTTPAAPLYASIESFTLKNITCNYIDSTTQTTASVAIPELSVGGYIKGDTMAAKALGSIEMFNVTYPETNAHLMHRTKLAFDVIYSNDSVTIKSLNLDTDGASIAVSGDAILGDEIFTDVAIDIEELDLGELIKYAPDTIMNEFGIQKVQGLLSMNAKVNGVYAENKLPRVDAVISMKEGLVQTKDYPEIKALSFSGKVSNGTQMNNQTTMADFDSFHFESGQSVFDFAFSVLDIDHPQYDVKTKFKVNIDDFKSVIPDTLVNQIQGKIAVDFSTRGTLADSIDDAFIEYAMSKTKLAVKISDFGVQMDSVPEVKNFGVNFSYKPNNIKVSGLKVSVPDYGVNIKNTGLQVYYQGSVFNTASMKLDVPQFNIETDSTKISGSAKVKNLDHPTFELNTDALINFGEFAHLVPDTLLTTLNGKIKANIKTHGTLDLESDSIADIATDIVFKNSAFRFQFEGIDVEMPDDPLTKVDDFSGVFEMDQEGIRINDLSVTAAGILFEMDSTTVDNVYETIIKESRDTQIVLQTKVHIGTIDYNALAPMLASDTAAGDSASTESQMAEETTTESTDSVSAPLLPDFEELGVPHFLVRGKFSIDKILYEKNVIDDISMLFRFADSLYVIDQFKLKTCKGETNTSMMLDARNWEKPKVDIKNVIKGLDLNELLVVNDNFDQTDMTSENLSGILTSELHARAFYVDGDWPTDKVRVKGNFTLENGKIYDFQPLVDASVGIGGLKELDKMDFNTLKTSIFMFKDKVYVPKTDVVSNALDLSAFAMHGVDSTLGYEYHLVLHLGDVLTGKNEKLMDAQAKQNKEDGGTVERSGLNLVSLNLPDDKGGYKKKNGFDNDKLKNKFMKSLKRQESFLNLLFDPRLVNFSTDIDRTQFVKSQKNDEKE